MGSVLYNILPQATRPVFGGLLVLAVPLDAVLPRGHDDAHLAHVRPFSASTSCTMESPYCTPMTPLVGDALAKPARSP